MRIANLLTENSIQSEGHKATRNLYFLVINRGALVEVRKKEKTLRFLGPLLRAITGWLHSKNETASKVAGFRGVLRGGRLQACFVFSISPGLVPKDLRVFSFFLTPAFTCCREYIKKAPAIADAFSLVILCKFFLCLGKYERQAEAACSQHECTCEHNMHTGCENIPDLCELLSRDAALFKRGA